MSVTQKKKINGFTLIEALVFIFIFSIISLAFYSTISLGSQYILEVKNRLGAVALAREKMEIIRNLKYEDIGTIGGTPEGDLSSDEEILVGQKTYNVKTYVYYIDDSFDGLTNENDDIPNDYKTVKIVVSWNGPNNQTSSVNLVSRFVPLSLETELGDGILAIDILDSYGSGISGATIDIVNVPLSVNLPGQTTDENGFYIYTGPASDSPSYQITVSKDGYETVVTEDPGAEAYTPVDSHASLIESVYNLKTIIINKLSNLSVVSVDDQDNSIGNVSFHLEGGRILGSDFSVPTQTVYNFNEDADTGNDGEITYSDISPGNYFISDIEEIDGYTFIGTDPVAVETYSPLSLAPDSSETLKIRYASNSAPALLVHVSEVDYDPALPINDAEVRLTNGSDYDETITTSGDGLAFFSLTNDPPILGPFTLEISAPGYVDPENQELEITNILVEESVELTPE